MKNLIVGYVDANSMPNELFVNRGKLTPLSMVLALGVGGLIVAMCLVLSVGVSPNAGSWIGVR